MSKKPEIVSLDANIILRFLLGDHATLTAKASQILKGVEAGHTAVLCDPVNLAEVIYVMKSVYEFSNSEIASALEPLVKMEGFSLANKQRYLLALKLFAESMDHFGDACACAAALEECGGKLYSFDFDLSKVAGIKRLESMPG